MNVVYERLGKTYSLVKRWGTGWLARVETQSKSSLGARLVIVQPYELPPAVRKQVDA